MTERRKWESDEEVSSRHAVCNCGYCGEEHKTSIAEPVGGFSGREKTIGTATDGAVGDALDHIQDVAPETLTKNYQGTQRELTRGNEVSVKDSGLKTHKVKIETV